MKISNYNDAVSHPDFDKLLKLAQSQLERQYQANKSDISIIRLLANIYRKRGLLFEAKNKYIELLDSKKPTADDLYLKQIFSQESTKISTNKAMRAAPFLLIDNFLSIKEQIRIWSLIEEYKETFQDSKVTSKGVDKEVRDSKVIYKQDLKEIASFFLPKITKTVIENLSYLLISPFEINKKELQLTLHTNGDFFTIHKDSGKKNISRKVTFVYYFHQEPKVYQGGDLLLYDTDKSKDDYSMDYSRIGTRNNLLILFPSHFYHQVTPVSQQSDNFKEGRFTLNGWLHE